MITKFFKSKLGGPSRYFFNLTKEISKNNRINICAPFHINNYLKNLDKNSVYGYKINNFFFNNSPYKIQEFLKSKVLNYLNLMIQKKD